MGCNQFVATNIVAQDGNLARPRYGISEITCQFQAEADLCLGHVDYQNSFV